ncbi:MAG: hypothetical protein IJ213_05225 [Bacteroidales bacterium]|nr:hypothetical protein [Bacteroidales bacterium]
MNSVSVRLDIPSSELSFLKKIAKGMGWKYSNIDVDDRLYDAESGLYLNDETMQTVREIENGTAELHYAKDVEDLIVQCLK